MLRIRFAGLALPRTQAEERASLAAMLDRTRAVQRKQVGRGDQRGLENAEWQQQD
jgi:hypothetical protein